MPTLDIPDVWVADDPPDTEMQIDIRPNTHELAPAGPMPADLHPAWVYLASLANGSHRTMRAALDLAAEVLTAGRCDADTMPWPLLRYRHMAALRAWLMQNQSPATGNKVLAAVRGALRAAWQLGQMDTDSYMKACAVKPIKGEQPAQAAGRALSAGEFAALLRCCARDDTPAGPRDAALLGLGIVAGLRRAEIAGLQLDDWKADEKTLIVRGKRNKTRVVPIAGGLADALADWLAARGAWPGPLLCPVDKSGRVQQAGITPAAVYKALAKRADQAGVKAFSPHDLRRTFAGDLLDAGADIATVQRLMGHANVATTASYDRRGERAKREAVGRLHMAWERRG